MGEGKSALEPALLQAFRQMRGTLGGFPDQQYFRSPGFEHVRYIWRSTLTKSVRPSYDSYVRRIINIQEFCTGPRYKDAMLDLRGASP